MILEPASPETIRPKLKDRLCAVLQEQCANKIQAIEPREPVLESDVTLFEALFAGNGALSEGAQGLPRPVGDIVDRYVSIRVVHLQSFCDVIQWWKAQKEMLPSHYQILQHGWS